MSRNKRSTGSEFFGVRSALTDGPFLQHTNFLVAAFGGDDRDGLFYVETALLYFFDGARNSERHHNLMQHEHVFLHRTEHVARLDLVAFFDDGNEIPFFLVVDSVDGDAACDSVARHLAQLGKGTLNPVENTLDKTGSEFDGQGRTRGIYVFTGT